MSREAFAPSEITLCPVGPDDHDFLVAVYACSRAEEMTLVPWTAEQRDGFLQSQFNAQQVYYAKTYPTASHDIILASGRRVGRLYVARLDQEIRILDITLLPGERNVGIGSCLIKQLLDEAQRSRKLARIYVEQINPSMRLFERLGFSSTGQDGIHCLMEWSPGERSRGIGD